MIGMATVCTQYTFTIIVTVCCTAVVLRLRSLSKNRQEIMTTKTSNIDTKTTKILLSICIIAEIVAVFNICATAVFKLVDEKKLPDLLSYDEYMILEIVQISLLSFNSAVNFMVYFITSNEFRLEAKKLLMCRWKCKKYAKSSSRKIINTNISIVHSKGDTA